MTMIYKDKSYQLTVAEGIIMQLIAGSVNAYYDKKLRSVITPVGLLTMYPGDNSDE